MAETFEEQKSELPDFARYIDIVRRRHLYFLAPFFLGWLMVWGASWLVHPRYKSSTLILVEQPTMPKDYVQPNVSDNLQDRLQSITQQILSRTRLLLIIDKLHLYGSSRKALSPDDKVDLMRKDLEIELVRDARNDEISAFRISYSARDPRVAQSVAGEVKDLFVNENLKVRQEESENTTKFIEDRLADARAALAQQEEKVRQFEGAHEGELPTQEASNLQILSGLQSQLQNEQDALNTARQQRVYQQALLEQNSNAQGTTHAVSASSPEFAAAEADLEKLKAHLADLSSRYTDRYPEVQSVEEQITKAKLLRDRLLAESKRKGGAAAGDSSQSASIMQLQGQLQANQLEISNRERSIEELKVRINEYQGRLNSEPATEQQLAALTRGYEQSKANYDDLLKKKNESAMATSMEQMQQGERFTMLDPPSLPVKPDFPNRLKFCGLGLGVGLGFGILVAGVFEYLDDRLHSEKEIKAMLKMAVISEIPDVVSPLDEQRSKRKIAMGWVMAALVAGTILTGSAFSILHR